MTTTKQCKWCGLQVVWPLPAGMIIPMCHSPKQTAKPDTVCVHSFQFEPAPNNIEFQLLFVSLGDCVLVKKEVGSHFRLQLETDRRPEYHMFGSSDYPTLLHHSFADIRAAVDALEDKPVPRIEKVNEYHYQVVSAGDWAPLSPKDLDSLSQLAGKPLPIWTPKKGEWKRIYPDGGYRVTVERCSENDAPELAVSTPVEYPVEIYRYTRRRGE